MELLEGGNFGDLVTKLRHKIDDTDLFSLIDQFTAGVAKMHEVGVIHCGLKPDDLMLSWDHKILKIIDFGVAMDAKTNLIENESKVSLTTTLDSAKWLSPELREVVRRSYSRKSDYYACGLII